VVRRVDLVRLVDGAVVEPEDDIAVVAVAVVEVGAGDRDGLVCVLGEDGERAGGVEANAFDGVAVDVVFA